MSKAVNLLFPPKPTLTEKNLADQSGKVFIVTGGSSGVGKELCGILYGANARVYVAARSESKTRAAIDEMKAKYPKGRGELIYLNLDLNDLSTIKKSADEFLSKELKLDVLWLNAGVMVPPQGSKTAQGYELQLGTNNLAHFLFTLYLLPILKSTARTAPKNSVRVIWVSSSAVGLAPKPPIDFNNMDYHKEEGPWTKYGRSKAGNVLHSVEFARRTKGTGIISLALNPGNLKSNLQQNMPKWQKFLFQKTLSHDPIFGAYTELYAGLEPTIIEERNGGWLEPWGHFDQERKDLWDPELGRKYWEWSEEQVKPYL